MRRRRWRESRRAAGSTRATARSTAHRRARRATEVREARAAARGAAARRLLRSVMSTLTPDQAHRPSQSSSQTVRPSASESTGCGRRLQSAARNSTSSTPDVLGTASLGARRQPCRPVVRSASRRRKRLDADRHGGMVIPVHPRTRRLSAHQVSPCSWRDAQSHRPSRRGVDGERRAAPRSGGHCGPRRGRARRMTAASASPGLQVTIRNN